MRQAMRVELKYLMPDEDSRTGKPRLFVRKNGRKIRMREKPGTPAFLEAYTAAVEALSAPARGNVASPRKNAPHGSLGWLAGKYFASQAWKQLDEVSRRTRRAIIEECLRERHKSGNEMALVPAKGLNASHVQFFMEQRADKDGAANNRLKYLSAMFGWAVGAKHLTMNPARDVKPVRYATDGFYTWTDEDVRKYEETHPVGSMARLALTLLMFTGVRRSDVVEFGRQHVRGSRLVFVPKKTKYLRSESITLPILPVLAEVIAATKCGDLTFLINEYGRPFTKAGFGNRFRKWCDKAGLPQCTAHGLRKAAATRAAEAGATDRELMAIFGWSSSSQATVYTRKADQARMAAKATVFLAVDKTEDCPAFIAPQKKQAVAQ